MNVAIRQYEGGCEIALKDGKGHDLYVMSTIDVFKCRDAILKTIEEDINNEIIKQLTQFNTIKSELK